MGKENYLLTLKALRDNWIVTRTSDGVRLGPPINHPLSNYENLPGPAKELGSNHPVWERLRKVIEQNKISIPTVSFKPTASDKPSAGDEPTAGAEPSAGAKTSAGAEPSASAEPSAGAEPSASAEPSLSLSAEPVAGAKPGFKPGANPDAFLPQFYSASDSDSDSEALDKHPAGNQAAMGKAG
jgi:hypothetical protein